MSGIASLPLRVGLVAGLFLLAGVSGAPAQDRVGVSSAVNPEATSRPPGGTARRLVIGQEIVFNERILTEANGQTQLLFLDESSMTVGPNSDLTIDQFVFDPKTGSGKLAMSATRGLLRYVGGKLSKQDDAVTLRTSTATLAVRGGAFIASIGPNGTDAIFIYGKGLTATGAVGGSQTVIRPGYHVTISPGGSASPPAPTPPGQLAGFTQQLDGRTGGTGGATTIPTDTSVANSGLSQTISGNLDLSLQQSVQNQGGTQITSLTLTNNLGSDSQIQNNASAGPVIGCEVLNTCPQSTQQVGTTAAGDPVGGANSVTGPDIITGGGTPPPSPPPSVTYTVSPNPARVSGDVGSLTFTVTRSQSSAAETVFVSTVQDRGFTSNGNFVELNRQPVNFAAGQSSALVSVTINNLGLGGGSNPKTFSFVVLQNIGDPFSAAVATDTFTIVNNVAGRLKNTDGNSSFVSQSVNGDTGFTGGTLTFPEGAPQQGVFTANANNSLGTISFPLVPCSTAGGCSASVQGTSSTLGAFTGTSFLSADNTFFYANLTPVSQPAGQPTQRFFIAGGLPVSPSFYLTIGPGMRPQAGSNTRIFAFQVKSDAALQSNIPFVRSQAGGNLPNATVSPLYVVAPPATPIGDAATVSAARALQASLAFDGQGANQKSVIAVTTGTIASQQDGQPILNGQLRGSSLLASNGAPVRIGSAVSTTVDGKGNSFYGGNTISGFVVDQTAFAPGSNGVVGSPIIPSTASEIPLSGAATPYGFAQPVLPAAVPSGVGANRTTQAIAGNFGGLMYSTAQPTPYIVTGGAFISTDAPNNRVQANLNGSAQNLINPSLPPAGVTTVAMRYGGLTGAPGGQAFIDNSTFAAAESATSPQQITINGTTSQPTGQLYLASAGAAGTPASLLPSAAYCQCQFLQWGYWGGDLNSTDANGPRIDRGHINTWVAGTATPGVDLSILAASSNPSGTYTGHAIGSVFNNGASYVAAGTFNGTYNFATQNGSFAISNFDGRSFAATGKAPLTGANYSFAVTSPGAKGAINGTFYGPMAKETGGNFAVQTTLGPPYLASGIYAGKR